MTDTVALQTSTRLAVTDQPDIRWWRGPDGFDHAFGALTRWFTSLCPRKVRWTAALTPCLANTPSNPCPDCELLANGTESEKREAFGG